MSFLNSTQILEADDLPHEDVEVPEWGGTVRVIGLDGESSSKFSSQMVVLGDDGNPKSVDLDNFQARLLVLTLHDENNNRLFNEEQIKKLGKKSSKVLTRLATIAQRLSGMDQAQAKNSSGTPAAASPTA
jgi:hypothetical protein